MHLSMDLCIALPPQVSTSGRGHAAWWQTASQIELSWIMLNSAIGLGRQLRRPVRAFYIAALADRSRLPDPLLLTKTPPLFASGPPAL